MSRNIDVLIFGASGFTGKYCIPKIAKHTKNTQIKWGIAGRSHEKLKSSLEFHKNEIGKPIETIPILIADVTDESSLREMARRSSVIINCCGPFLLYGEPVVKACIEQGTHYIDVTGEIQFMEEIKKKYDHLAREKGVYVISACGFDSIPADLGVAFLQKNFQGTLNSVDLYFEIKEEVKSVSGSFINFGTYESAIQVLGNVRKMLGDTKLPDLEPKTRTRCLPHKPEVVQGWAVPFPGTDRTVIKRSQLHFYEDGSKRPVQAQTYFVLNSFFNVVLMGLFSSMILLFSQFSATRRLLFRYPHFFTNGYVTLDKPDQVRMDSNTFTITLHGKGWHNNHDVTLMAEVKGRNIIYGTTSTCLVLSALTILTEKDKMPPPGVLAPGYAFIGTTLVDKLNQNGVTFEIV